MNSKVENFENSVRREEIISKIILVSIFSFFAYNNFSFLVTSEAFKVSVLILFIFNSLIIFFTLMRNPPKQQGRSIVDVGFTLMGTYSPIFYAATGQAEVLPLQLLTISGFCFSLWGLLSLRKSFALLPANRGVVTSGAYRLVRHPIYAGYLITNTCFMIENFSLWNLAFFSTFIMGETVRIIREEKLLMESEDYKQFSQTTKWRVIPFVW